MSEQEHIKTVEKIFDTINAHELHRNDDAYAKEYQYSAPGAPGTMNLDQSTAYIEGFFTAFPDLHFELKDKIAQDDLVAVSWIGTGTHKGALRTPTGSSLPATNKKAQVPGTSIYHFKDGKITSSQIYWDMVTLLAQIGMMPGM